MQKKTIAKLITTVLLLLATLTSAIVLLVFLVKDLIRDTQIHSSSGSAIPYYLYLITILIFVPNILSIDNILRARFPKFSRILTFAAPFLVLLQSLYGSVELAKLSYPQLYLTLWNVSLVTIINIAFILASLIYSIYFLRFYFSKTRFSATDLLWVVLIFLFIIILFSDIYLIIYSGDKSSFIGVNQQDAYKLFADFFYFSTITFTTLGYGDIVPVSTTAKFVVSIEALFFTIGISTILVFIVQKASRSRITIETNLAESVEQGNQGT